MLKDESNELLTKENIRIMTEKVKQGSDAMLKFLDEEVMYKFNPKARQPKGSISYLFDLVKTLNNILKDENGKMKNPDPKSSD